MILDRAMPVRERVFVQSLLRHGFRHVDKRKDFKLRRGYIISSTKREDAVGIDFFVKMPKDLRLLPVQITQRGVQMFRHHNNPSEEQIAVFMRESEVRLKKKRAICARSGIAFVLVTDYWGTKTNRRIAWRDKKALLHAIGRLR